MDVRSLTLPPSSYDLVIDKGTLDCVWLGGQEGVEAMLNGVERVLRVGGAYVCFSLYGHGERMEGLEEGGWLGGEGEGKEGRRRRRRREWQVMYHVLEGPLEMPQQPHTYLYVCIRHGCD